MVCDGEFYPQPSWERRISETDCGLWPTPRANERSYYQNDRGDKTKSGAVRMWPTPRANKVGGYSSPGFRPTLEQAVTFATPQARDWRTGSANRWEDARKGIRSCNLNDQLGGKLNPTWVGWLMGFPLGWLSLRPLETRKFQQWLRGHGVC
jgi:hypothetical protein